MNYSLALELKNAGFPNDWESRCGHCGYDYGSNYPTLSELIEACGDRFRLLSTSPEHKEWQAMAVNLAGELKLKRTGETPEVAVAKLWLILKKINGIS